MVGRLVQRVRVALPPGVRRPLGDIRRLVLRRFRPLALRSGSQLHRAFRESDVFMMYTADSTAHDAYQPTMIAWGDGATTWQVYRLHKRGTRYVGSVWTLTAGAKNLATDAELAEAVARNLSGDPIVVPWRADVSHAGTPEFFGCTSNPRFQSWVLENLRLAMACGADGLHVDDHLGTAQTVPFGGGFCDHCLKGFRTYLREHLAPEQQSELGLDLDIFDYRRFIEERTTGPSDYLERRRQLPLSGLFEKYHLDAAAAFTARLGAEARRLNGQHLLLSANLALPDLRHLVVGPRLTHFVSEINHITGAWRSDLPKGERRYNRLFTAYRLADQYRRRVIITAGLGDWQWVAARGGEDMARLWIGLAYAHGHFFMVPAPDGQYMFTLQAGTGRYEAPISAYAPVYEFIRKNADWFDGFETLETRGDEAGDLRTVLRRRPDDGRLAVHLLDVGFDGSSPRAAPRADLLIDLPDGIPEGSMARILHYDRKPLPLEIVATPSGWAVAVPEFRLWGVITIEPPR